MKRPYLVLLILATTAFIFNRGCSSDEGGVTTVPEADRGEQAIEDDVLLIEYLETHFYNYEEFENPPSGFNYEVVIDTIAGENADRTPLIDQVRVKTVTEEEVDQRLYYLVAQQGVGENPTFTDSTLVTYRGALLDGEQFDVRTVPLWLDITATVRGFNQGIIELRTSGDFVDNGDGTGSFEDQSAGAVFMPSGLAYFSSPPPGIPLYASLVFTFSVYRAVEIDHDNDGIPSQMEDLNDNENPFDDDSDRDLVPDFRDANDDNDSRLTMDEIEILDDGTIIFTDTNGDGTPDYLDPDL